MKFLIKSKWVTLASSRCSYAESKDQFSLLIVGVRGGGGGGGGVRIKEGVGVVIEIISECTVTFQEFYDEIISSWQTIRELKCLQNSLTSSLLQWD